MIRKHIIVISLAAIVLLSVSLYDLAIARAPSARCATPPPSNGEIIGECPPPSNGEIIGECPPPSNGEIIGE
ncbi:hypothetical protein A3K80_08590 [Candidatus Bathyarchaeota archaeon RBG_13_38_9]|nr:MAG: hypothetical protein A3K80_08590 [Candidatus Bathyarchaeota archaeon RBG_13_38_9]